MNVDKELRIAPGIWDRETKLSGKFSDGSTVTVTNPETNEAMTLRIPGPVEPYTGEPKPEPEPEPAPESEGKTIGLRMAKASQEDLQAAMVINGILSDVIEDEMMPRDATGEMPEDADLFDPDNFDHLRRFYDVLNEAYYGRPGGMNRVVWGTDTLLNPANNLLDPDVDHLAPHPDIVALPTKLETARLALQNINFHGGGCLGETDWTGDHCAKIAGEALKATT